MFFDNWFGLLRVLVVGTLGYVGLVAMLRISGKRTLSKLNAFDLVVTVALGSTLASMLLTEQVALVEGLAALGLLIGLQFCVTWLQYRWPLFGRIVTSEPALIYYRGSFLRQVMRRERVTEPEVLRVVRQAGVAGLEDVEAIVLEPAAELSVIRRAGAPASALHDVPGADPRAEN